MPGYPYRQRLTRKGSVAPFPSRMARFPGHQSPQEKAQRIDEAIPMPKSRPGWDLFKYLAEREGFEPSRGYYPLPVFKTGAFNHSATSPGCAGRILRPVSRRIQISVQNLCLILWRATGTKRLQPVPVMPVTIGWRFSGTQSGESLTAEPPEQDKVMINCGPDFTPESLNKR